MKITVVGGCGGMGKSIVRHLLEIPEVSTVLIADANLEQAEAFAREVSSEKLSIKKVDILDHQSLISVLRGSQVAINASWYEFNLRVMKAALEVKSHYLDLGGLYHVTNKQLELNESFKKAGITAILGVGASPGITNVLARYGANQLDQVDEIHIRAGTKGGGGFAYSARTILDEATMNPVLYENGTFKEVEPLSGKETYRLLPPVGEVQGFYSLHSEIATLPFTIKGVKTVTFRVAFSPSLIQKVNSLVELGLLNSKPVSIRGVAISPKDFVYDIVSALTAPPSLDEFKALQVELIGKKKAEKKHLSLETVVKANERWKLRATAIWTGVPAAIGAYFLGKGKVELKGALPPEIAIDPIDFMAELSKREIHIFQNGERLNQF